MKKLTPMEQLLQKILPITILGALLLLAFLN